MLKNAKKGPGMFGRGVDPVGDAAEGALADIEERRPAGARAGTGEGARPTQAEIQTLKRGVLNPSRTNPRKNFDPAKLEELAGTIKQFGILEPLLVRHLYPRSVGFEIIAGERRYRAAELAGLEELPCIVKELSDAEVLEVQYIENLQRDDLTALEEAEGFRRLIDSGAYTAESLAAKLGKSRSHIFGRLRLARLQGKAREELERGNIAPTIAALAGQLPTAKLQERFVTEVIDFGHSFRDAQEFLEERFVRRLNGEFDLEAADLVKGCGPCTACPKRSGNMEESEGSPNVCTDVECWERKRIAAGRLRLAEAEAAGGKVVREKEWKKLGYNARTRYPTPEDHNYEAPYGSPAYGKSWRKLLKKELPLVLVETEKGVQERVDREAAEALLRGKGVLRTERNSQGGKSQAEKEAERERKIHKVATQRAMAELTSRLGGDMTGRLDAAQEERFHRLLCSAILNDEIQIYDSYEHAFARRGLVVEERKDQWGGKVKDRKKPFLKHFAELSAPELRGLLAELILGVRAYGDCDYIGGKGHFQEACKLWGVKLEEIAQQVREELKGLATQAKVAKGAKKEGAGTTKGAKDTKGQGKVEGAGGQAVEAKAAKIRIERSDVVTKPGKPNAHGVFEKPERHKLTVKGFERLTLELLVAQDAKGWHSAYQFNIPGSGVGCGGCGGLPNEKGEWWDSREAALRCALLDLIEVVREKAKDMPKLKALVAILEQHYGSGLPSTEGAGTTKGRTEQNAKVAKWREKNGVKLEGPADVELGQVVEGLKGVFNKGEMMADKEPEVAVGKLEPSEESRPAGKLSPAARERIAAAQRANWAKATGRAA